MVKLSALFHAKPNAQPSRELRTLLASKKALVRTHRVYDTAWDSESQLRA